jgi:hypothetical protein
MKIVFDPAKRSKTLVERGVDFLDAERVFDGEQFTSEDARQDYGGQRFVTIGELSNRWVVVGWTLREEAGEIVRRVFSMRRASEKEIARVQERLR